MPCGSFIKIIIHAWYNMESFLSGDSLERGFIFLICFLSYTVFSISLEVGNTANGRSALLENLYLLGLFDNLPGTDF